METLTALVTAINNIVWGPPMLVLLLGTGIFLSALLRLMPIRTIGLGLKLMVRGMQKSHHDGDVTPFTASMTALAATIGTGNIAGVATAIALGGPGALFWMWMTALFGMATKYAEGLLAVHYREVDAKGSYSGGPMYYIQNGLHKKWRFLAIAFAIFGSMAGFGIGNMVQANSVADAMAHFGVERELSALLMFVATAVIILGGVKRIGAVSNLLVPVMAIVYVITGLIIILLNITELPAILSLVFTSAFTGHAAAGGFAGASIMLAIQAGVARGIFSNESGLGSAPIAHAAARTDNPVAQGLIAASGTFIDTLIVCTITGMVILLSGAWQEGLNGAVLSSAAFSRGIPGGGWIVSVSLVLFAYSTILGWAYYSERCVVYLVGVKGLLPFRILWIIAVPLGVMAKLEFVWLLADTLNALMAIPNLIALLLLSPVVIHLTRNYLPALLHK